MSKVAAWAVMSGDKIMKVYTRKGDAIRYPVRWVTWPYNIEREQGTEAARLHREQEAARRYPIRPLGFLDETSQTLD